MAAQLPNGLQETPSIVLIGVPHKKALEKVINKLIDHSIDFSDFYETDNDMGLSAVATVPLTEEQREILRGYKLWNESTFNNTRIAQRSERHSPQGRVEVVGSNPATRTNDWEGFNASLGHHRQVA